MPRTRSARKGLGPASSNGHDHCALSRLVDANRRGRARRLPNIAATAEARRGKRSVHVDLCAETGREALWRLVEDAHVFSQGHHPES